MSLVTSGPFESEPKIGNLSGAHAREAVELLGGCLYLEHAAGCLRSTFLRFEKCIWRRALIRIFFTDAEVSC